MRILVPVTSSHFQTVDIATPAYYKDLSGIYTCITEDCIITVSEAGAFGCFVSKKEYNGRYQADVISAIKGKEISKERFESIFNNYLKCLAGQYQSINIMNTQATGPKDGAQEETTTTTAAPAEAKNTEVTEETNTAAAHENTDGDDAPEGTGAMAE